MPSAAPAEKSFCLSDELPSHEGAQAREAQPNLVSTSRIVVLPRSPRRHHCARIRCRCPHSAEPHALASTRGRRVDLMRRVPHAQSRAMSASSSAGLRVRMDSNDSRTSVPSSSAACLFGLLMHHQGATAHSPCRSGPPLKGRQLVPTRSIQRASAVGRSVECESGPLASDCSSGVLLTETAAHACYI